MHIKVCVCVCIFMGLCMCKSCVVGVFFLVFYCTVTCSFIPFLWYLSSSAVEPDRNSFHLSGCKLQYPLQQLCRQIWGKVLEVFDMLHYYLSSFWFVVRPIVVYCVPLSFSYYGYCCSCSLCDPALGVHALSARL